MGEGALLVGMLGSDQKAVDRGGIGLQGHVLLESVMNLGGWVATGNLQCGLVTLGILL